MVRQSSSVAYVLFTATEALIASLGGASQHPEDLDSAPLQPFHLSPKLVVSAVVRLVVVQGDVARALVEVNGSNYDMGDACVVGEKRQERVVAAVRIVKRLVVYDEAWALGCRQQLRGSRRH